MIEELLNRFRAVGAAQRQLSDGLQADCGSPSCGSSGRGSGIDGFGVFRREPGAVRSVSPSLDAKLSSCRPDARCARCARDSSCSRDPAG